MPAALIRELVAIVGADNVLTDPDLLRGYEVDWTGRFVGATTAVARPASADEVSAIVALCRARGAALVPQGGNTGLVGGGVPLHGEVVLSLRRLDLVGDVDVLARQITVGAGVTVEAVQRAALAAGLRYAVDFGARGSATVGGTIATNAGGINVLRYGGTREQLVGIEAVLGTGHLISRLNGLVKDNTGYHLPSLLCGSEGTLGIVTAARLRLVAAPAQHVTAIAGFATVADAVEAVGLIRSTFDRLDAAELMLADGVALVCSSAGVPMPMAHPWAALVLLEASGSHDVVESLGAVVEAARSVGDVVVATDPQRRAALWRLREEHTASIGRLGVPHKFDVTIPAAMLARFVAEVPTVVAGVEPGARTWQFGHVGDGNIHVNVTGVVGPDDVLAETIYRYACGLGGCISAEHGIGTAKARWLHLDRSADEVAAMRVLKHAFDPDGILNPAVLVPVT
ncbi:MAG: D-lactate dehydrogenase [Acidimicrobiaceae bacterium]|nr:MAG: D-lactate dehydrogenase [Acidimicrobiaceae bacterium]